jgi:hypothetical protein
MRAACIVQLQSRKDAHMSVRQQINTRPWLGYAAGAALIILALAIILRSQLMSRPRILLSSKSYFSTDDGKTTFVDSVTRPTPFRLPDGREAVLAHVFTQNGNDRFVAYLQRDDGGNTVNVQKPVDSTFEPASLASRIVKRPGDKTWVMMTSIDGMKIMNVRGSDGVQATEVQPESQ